MAWTDPTVRATGDLITAAIYNTDLVDNLAYLYSSRITGVIPAAGTTPSLGTGFTYTHTNSTGIYVFSFTTSFAAVPTVLITPLQDSAFFSATSVSVSGFHANAHGGSDSAFNFVAVETV